MLNFNDKYFFLKPLGLSKRNMDFEVYASDGTLLGVNSSSFTDTNYVSEDEKSSFEEFIQKEAMKAEAKIKFLKQYHVPVEKADILNVEASDILDCMEHIWNVPCEVMDELIGDTI